MGEPEDIKVEEGEQEQPSEPQQGGGFSIGKLIEWLLSNLIPIIIAVVVSTIIAVVLFNSSITKKQEEEYKTVQLAPKPAPLAIFPMDEFRVNTADKDEVHYIRITLALAYDDKKYKVLPTELARRKDQIRDIILEILSSKQKQDLDDELSKERLKDEIIKDIDDILSDDMEISDIYYQEFIIS